jgi:hypothetical protein
MDRKINLQTIYYDRSNFSKSIFASAQETHGPTIRPFLQRTGQLLIMRGPRILENPEKGWDEEIGPGF